jgi:hypothetical protein
LSGALIGQEKKKKIALVWYKKKKEGKTHSVNPREKLSKSERKTVLLLASFIKNCTSMVQKEKRREKHTQ